jgi:hypothetical protein
MGQYHRIVNLDKKQYLNPHYFGDGAKLMEFACSSMGVLAALAILLADSNGRGGGDLHSTHPIIGTWAGDRIVVTGDYGDEGAWAEAPDGSLYAATCSVPFVDVSDDVLGALCDDSYTREALEKSTKWHAKEEGAGPNLRKLHGVEPDARADERAKAKKAMAMIDTTPGDPFAV